jgi:hypothetical protein
MFFTIPLTTMEMKKKSKKFVASSRVSNEIFYYPIIRRANERIYLYMPEHIYTQLLTVLNETQWTIVVAFEFKNLKQSVTDLI